ncbi:MAG: S41 family peptidase [Lachnospiraceae bacterium]|nr:S41 family peptidase [Lachnospiraceae bacterium]
MEDYEKRENENKAKSEKKSFMNGLFTGVMAAVLVMTAVFCIKQVVIIYGNKASVKTAQKGAADDTKEQETSVVNDDVLEKMQAIEKVVDYYYYEEDVERAVIEEGIYDGMMASLGDPYSTYYSEEELKDIMEQTEGIYYGIGAYISLDMATGLGQISGVIAGTPAEAANLREGDLIYEVDGESAAGLELTDITGMIKGEEGTIVHLTLIREGENDYVEVDIERRKVESPTVNYEVYDNGMGYIQITEFDEITVDQFTEAMAVCKGSDVKGIILDLRSNPGGNLSAVVDIARAILPEGLIVYTEDRDGKRTEYSCDGANQIKIPMVVLINGNSASASEILAGAIQDYGIGTLVGTTSYGKGIVQRIVSLADGSAVKLTVSSYFTPNGNNIHGIGIEPDIVCEFDSDSYYEKDIDNQLEEAKKVLQKMIEE